MRGQNRTQLPTGKDNSYSTLRESDRSYFTNISPCCILTILSDVRENPRSHIRLGCTTVNSENGTTSQNPVVVGIAITILIAYGAVAWFLFTQIGVASETWTRYTFLLGGIEAIAFAAVGYLFGREVHRQQAAKAEKRANDAQADANAANKLAVDAQRKGRDLAELLSLKAGARPVADVSRTDSPEYQLKEAAEYARRLFPE